MKKILLTGGGSAGHVTPNLSLIESFQSRGDQCFYIGSFKGIERNMLSQRIKYYPVCTGKLRRYFSLQNFIDPFFILIGFFQSLKIIHKEKPDLLFSKGGFVSTPVVYAAKFLKVPIYIHESDSSPGLATKLAAKHAKTIFVSDPQAKEALSEKYSNVQLVDLPIQSELLSGDSSKIKFKDDSKKTLLVMGGSLGAKTLNDFISENLSTLSKQWNILHLTGRDHFESMPSESTSYKKYSFLQSGLGDLYAKADLILARAGATSLREYKALKKKCILIPLPKSQSRGEQIQNANDFAKKYPASVILDEDLNLENFQKSLNSLKGEYPKADSKNSILNFI